MTRTQAWAKRGIDILASAGGILALWWLIAAVYVVASIDCRASGFFRQQRIGRHGRPFNVIKIRTMRDDPAVRTHVTTAQDPRITRIGGILRRFKLDELPQLFNVLAGHMSLVGPRPDVAGFADELQGDDRQILELRPGVTGPATLKFRDEERILASVEDPETYNRDVIWPEKVRINLDYLRNYTLRRDFRIILHTLVGGQGD